MSPDVAVRGPARARLEIDLDALAHNWRMLRARVAPAACAAVVKADAYGLGLAPVARTLHAAGCRDFFTARLEEAVALRQLLEDVRIFCLDGVGAGEERELLAHRLVPVLNHPGELAHWQRTARRRGQRLRAALHLDTGMTRLGFTVAEFAAIEPAVWDEVAPVLLMSHLACADEPDHPLNARQRERFDAATRSFAGRVVRSLAASSGIFLGRAWHFDLVRPGVALYGVNPTPGRPNPMRPVVRLVAPVLRIYTLTEPATVGYGATYEVPAGARIATVAVGYADGLPRAASNRGRARIGDIEVPYAGRVSMDLLGLDVSKLPEGMVRPGVEVELIWGPDGVDRLAAAAETIGYEVLTRLGRRFARHYRGGLG